MVHAVVHQETDVNQGFVAAKARLAKKSLTIPRKELVAGHMSANLVRNVKKALENLPIQNVYGWLDSTVALHWIKGNGEYKQFVSNHVKKIKSTTFSGDTCRQIRTSLTSEVVEPNQIISMENGNTVQNGCLT